MCVYMAVLCVCICGQVCMCEVIRTMDHDTDQMDLLYEQAKKHSSPCPGQLKWYKLTTGKASEENT